MDGATPLQFVVAMSNTVVAALGLTLDAYLEIYGAAFRAWSRAKQGVAMAVGGSRVDGR